jgi:hypothetical protein
MPRWECQKSLWSAVLIACLLVAVPAHAGSVAILGDTLNSAEGLGSFDGTLEYDADPFSTVGMLEIMLTNTSAPDNGGYITGFLFNIASEEAVTATLLSDPGSPYPFEQCLGGGLNGQPFGNPYDAGAALDGTFLGGGDPTRGIAVGDSGTFAFRIESADAGSLTAMSFLEGGPYDFDFIVRFRGFDDGGSDKVPAVVVPLPVPLALGAIGLVGAMIGAARWRRSAGVGRRWQNGADLPGAHEPDRAAKPGVR